MKRLSLVVAMLAAVFSFATPATAAGPHFMKTVPACQVDGYTVTCDSSVIAGVGNYDAKAVLTVSLSIAYECHNPGTNQKWVPPHDAVNSDTDDTGPINPKNGKLTVPQTSASAAGGGLPAKPCPNGNWDAVITSESFTWDYSIIFLSDPPEVFFHLSS